MSTIEQNEISQSEPSFRLDELLEALVDSLLDAKPMGVAVRKRGTTGRPVVDSASVSSFFRNLDFPGKTLHDTWKFSQPFICATIR